MVAGAGSSVVALKPVVLVAEDDPIVRELIQEVLEVDLRAEVHAAAGGVELLRMLETMEKRPSVVLLDMVMPDLDGFEITRLLRDDPRLRGIPIVAVTAQMGREAMLAAGCSAVVEKPFHVDDLVQVIRETLAAA